MAKQTHFPSFFHRAILNLFYFSLLPAVENISCCISLFFCLLFFWLKKKMLLMIFLFSCLQNSDNHLFIYYLLFTRNFPLQIYFLSRTATILAKCIILVAWSIIDSHFCPESFTRQRQCRGYYGNGQHCGNGRCT